MKSTRHSLIAFSLFAMVAAMALTFNAWRSVAMTPAETVPDDFPDSISGTVLMPNGDPAADAPVMLFWHKPRARAKTGADGTFKLNLDVKKISEEVGDDWPRMAIASAVPGTGPGWEVLRDIDDPTAVTIQLVDDVPVSGKILDQQGRPVAGASVSIQSMHRAPDGNLDGFLKASRDQPTRVWLYERDSMRYLSPEAMLKLLGETDQQRPTATTDESGQFTFTGFGKERSLLASVAGPGITRETFYIATRPAIDARWKRGQPSRETLMMLESGAAMLSVYPAKFHHLASPAMTLHGTLTDATSGTPVAGMNVLASMKGHRSSSNSVSDESGRYEISGLPLAGELRLSALNPGDLPYLDAQIQLTVNATSPPQPIDFELDRGVRVSGSVLDKRTGEGVAGNVGYLSWPDNPKLNALHQAYDTFNTMSPQQDGTYSIVVPHGPGVLTFGARNRSQYDPAAEPDFGFPVTAGGMFASGNRGLVRPEHFHFLKRIDPAEEQSQLEVDITIGRGPVQSVNVVRSDGGTIKELDARGVVTNTLSRFRGGQFDVMGLQPGEKRSVFLRDQEKQFAGVFELQRSLEPTSDALELKLEPSAATSGRITDDSQRPLSRWYVAAVTAGAMQKMLATKSRIRPAGAFEFDETSTDSDGYFRFTGLPSNVAIDIIAMPRGTDQKTQPKVVKTITLRPGSEQDLGQIKVDR